MCGRVRFIPSFRAVGYTCTRVWKKKEKEGERERERERERKKKKAGDPHNPRWLLSKPTRIIKERKKIRKMWKTVRIRRGMEEGEPRIGHVVLQTTFVVQVPGLVAIRRWDSLGYFSLLPEGFFKSLRHPFGIRWCCRDS